jgi:4-amino-4-deoxy-L-arabinose transferase-like glycosyltransferase
VIVNKIRNHIARLLLTAIFIVLASSTVAWTIADQTPPSWDPCHHIVAAYDYYRPLAHLDFVGFKREFFDTTHYYAPFIHLVSALVFLIFGASRLTGIAVNLISLAVLLGSVYWIGKTLYARAPDQSSDNLGKKDQAYASKDEAKLTKGVDGSILTLGVVAALLSTCYHFPAWLLHDAFLDYPLMALVALSFALLIRAADFHVRRDALLFGVAASLGLLSKQTFAFFFVLPALYVAVRAIATRDLRAVFNLLLAGIVMIAIAAIWYGPHWDDVVAIWKANQLAAYDEREPPLLSRDSNLYYLHSLISAQTQLPFGILFVLGLIYSLVRCRKQSLMLYLWLLSGVGIFTFIANKDFRYTVPVLPAVALLSVCWLREFKSRARQFERPDDNEPVARKTATSRRRNPAAALKVALVALIVVWAFASFFNAQWPKQGEGQGQGVFIDTPYFRWMTFARNYYIFDHRPLSHDWSVPEIVRAVSEFPFEADSRATLLSDPSTHITTPPRPPDPHEAITSPHIPGGDPDHPPRVTLGVVVNRHYLNSSSIALYARLLSQGRAGLPLFRVESISDESEIDRIQHCDYLLVRNELDRAEGVQPVERSVEKLLRQDQHQFSLVAAFPTPSRDVQAVIYRIER